MEFYREVFGGELVLNTFGEYGATGPEADMIMHGILETPSGFTLMGADTRPAWSTQSGSAITISLSGNDGAELHGYWDALSASGTVTMPLEKQMWGDEFGSCNDQFGVAWLVNISEA